MVEYIEREKALDAISEWLKNISMCFLWDKDGIEVFNDGFCNYGEKRVER